jgi:hypothetical protein
MPLQGIQQEARALRTAGLQRGVQGFNPFSGLPGIGIGRHR